MFSKKLSIKNDGRKTPSVTENNFGAFIFDKKLFWE